MKFKKDFPLFAKNLIYLDSAATAQIPRVVIKAMSAFMEKKYANVHRGIYPLSEEATQLYEHARQTVQQFIHAKNSEEIIFTRNATESLNLLADCLGKSLLQRGDHILLSSAEHHSNFLPWQRLSQGKKIILDIFPHPENQTLSWDDIRKHLHPKTKLVSLSYVSHVLGSVLPAKKIGHELKKKNILFVLDAAQGVAHLPIDVQKMRCDFLAFSGHKLGAPSIGVFYGKKQYLKTLPPFLVGGGTIRSVSLKKTEWLEAPWKFEAGTPNVLGAVALEKAIQYIQNIGWKSIRQEEKKLLAYATQKLRNIPGLKIYGPRSTHERSSVISFTITGIHPHDLADILGKQNICIRAGHHCAMPLMQQLKVPATSRISFWIYNEQKEIDKLVEGISRALHILRP